MAIGGLNKGAGRKAIPIDLKELEILSALHASDKEIAMARRFGSHDPKSVRRQKL